MNLFSLSAHYQRIMSSIMEIEEISDETMQEMLSINDSLEEKILNHTAIVKNIEAQATAIQKAMEDMQVRLDKLNKSASRVRDEIKKEMEACDKKKVADAYHAIQIISNNPKVEILDKSLLPFKYLREKITHLQEPDKISILDDLKQGMQVPGAKLVRENRLQIR